MPFSIDLTDLPISTNPGRPDVWGIPLKLNLQGLADGVDQAVSSTTGWAVITDSRFAAPDVGEAINNCIAALGGNGGTVYIPPGTWTGAVRPVLASGVVIAGAGQSASNLVFTSGGFLVDAALSDVHIHDVSVTASTGHVFEVSGASAGIALSSFRHCTFTAVDSTGGVWHQSNGGSFIDVEVSNCNLTHGATATVPAWYVNSTAGSCNQNTFRRCRANGGNNTTAPFFHIESSSAANLAFDNHFADITGEQNCGGLIKLLSVQNCLVDNCTDYDATSDYTADVIHVGTSGTGGVRSYGVKVTRSGRRGGTLSAGVFDVAIESASRNCVLELPSFSSTTVQYSIGTSDTVVISSAVVSAPRGLAYGNFGGTASTLNAGTSDPNGSVTGNVGDLFTRPDVSWAGGLLRKQTGNGTNSGWAPAVQTPFRAKTVGNRVRISNRGQFLTISASKSLAKNLILYMPMTWFEAATFSRLAILQQTPLVAASGTGTLFFATYAADAHGRPGALLADLTAQGGIDLTSGSTNVELITAAFGTAAVFDPTVPFIACMWTGTNTGTAVIQGYSGIDDRVDSSAASANMNAYSEAGAGSFPSTATPAAAATTGVAIWGQTLT
jgi:hypothetical protein